MWLPRGHHLVCDDTCSAILHTRLPSMSCCPSTLHKGLQRNVNQIYMYFDSGEGKLEMSTKLVHLEQAQEAAA